MEVKRFVGDFLDSNMYVFEEGNHGLIIDPIVNEDALKHCNGASSVTVLLTHEHFDHISGLNRIRELCAPTCRGIAGENCSERIKDTNYVVIASETCSERIQDTKANLSAYADVLAQLGGKQIPEHWEPFGCQAADVTFNKSYAFRWMGHAVELFSAPGHSAGSCCILLDDMLFVGDTVLENNLMVKFPGSSKKLYRSVTAPLLEKLLLGNRITRVYPGHGDVMTPEVALQIIRGV